MSNTHTYTKGINKAKRKHLAKYPLRNGFFFLVLGTIPVVMLVKLVQIVIELSSNL